MPFYLNLHPSVILLASIALGTIIYRSTRRSWARRQFAKAHGCKPIARSLSKDPFLGLDLLPGTLRAIKENRILVRSLENYKTHGNTFTVRELHVSAIVTIEPENIKTVLSLKFQDFCIAHRLKCMKPLLGEGIFDTDGDHWAASRALIRPSFNRDQVADLTSLESIFQDFFSLLPRDGETVVDLKDLFFRYTIDSATEFLFGQSVGTLKKSEAELGFADAFHYAQKAILMRGMLGPLEYFFPDRHAEECNRICRDFVQQFVDEAVNAVQTKNAEGEKPDPSSTRPKRIFSHELAAQTSDRTRILDELMNVLLAGRDTTASLLTNMFFMLAKNPMIWDKLRREVAFLEGRLPTYEELCNMKYVHCCMNESLRLHPVVPRNDRQAVRDTVLPLGGGKDGLSPIFVPKGTLVVYNLYAMHRRKDIYGPDADDFRPERWEDGKLMPRWGFLPFNGGPRICIGQRYALTEAAYVLVRMVQEFKSLVSRDPGEWEETRGLTVTSHNGAKVSLIPA
ncbi:hypothetical protein N7488_002694 [Penicillium malachiteum]|nr:hypothetical protein N7488_002694 [Penicillium malachiteum]